MKILYMDNFRGFTDTFISLKDVNFLVGESSTGKTSVLYLMSLLSSPDFWFNQDFKTEVAHLRSFEDIASNNLEPCCFGSMSTKNNTSEKNHVTAILLKFKNFGGIPRPFECNCVINSKYLRIVPCDKTIKYTIQPISLISQDDFRLWVHHCKNPIKKYKITARKVPPRLVFLLASVALALKTEFPEITPQDFLFLDKLVSLAPVRSKPRRVYDTYEKSFGLSYLTEKEAIAKSGF